MQKKIQFPKRAESLNIYKPQKSLQLPRFHSRPKNNLLSTKNNNNPHNNHPDSENSSVNSHSNTNNQHKNSMRLTKNQMVDIVNKIKQKKSVTKSKQKKPISEKRINPYFVGIQHAQQKQKLSKRQNIDNMQVKGQNGKDDKNQINNHRRHLTNTNQKLQQSSKKLIDFKSKSMKNAIKYQQSLIAARQKQKTKQNNAVKIQIKKKNVNFELPLHRRRISKQQKTQGQCSTQVTTEVTQPSVNDSHKSIWKKITEIFLNMQLDPDNLDWPQQYIVMQKQTIQKRMYQLLQQFNHSATKIKLRKHICISRIAVYLYSSLILYEEDTKSVIPILNKLHESFLIFNQVAHHGPNVLNNEYYHTKFNTVSKNNDHSFKMLLKVLNKKNVKHQDLFKNMLESSLKIQSIQFIQVLDKTLKWQILKMPSYPYLPPTSKQLHLVLDLDQTLIHYDYSAELFHVRPFAQQFLLKASKYFQITIFTAALQQYADQILNQIDPQHCISYKLYRNHLTYMDGIAIKDLNMLGRPLNKTIIIDNISTNFRMQPENGIQIRSWYDDDFDQILGKLYGMLIKIVQDYGHDVRIGIKEMSEFIKQQITKADLIYQLQKQL